MKKIFCYVSAVFLLGGFLLPMASYAGVAGQYSDQVNDNVSSIDGSIVVSHNAPVQTFTPTVTKITAVDLYLKSQGSGNLKVTIKKESDSSVVAPIATSVSFVGGNGWVTISYDDPFISVVPGTKYGIYAEIDGSNTAEWAWTNGDLYTGGEANGYSGLGADSDFLFYILGTKIESASAATTTTSTSTTSTTKAATAPVLVKYEINGQSADASSGTEIQLASGDKLNLTGTSFAGAVVTVFVGEKSYVADVDENGGWTVEILASELEEGSQIVTAQTKDGEINSEIVELFDVMVLGVKSNAPAVSTTKEGFLSNPLVIGGLIVLMLVLIGLLVFLERKYHGLAKLFKKKEKKIEEEIE
jgi:hypothetical protein